MKYRFVSCIDLASFALNVNRWNWHFFERAQTGAPCQSAVLNEIQAFRKAELFVGF